MKQKYITALILAAAVVAGTAGCSSSGDKKKVDELTAELAEEKKAKEEALKKVEATEKAKEEALKKAEAEKNAKEEALKKAEAAEKAKEAAQQADLAARAGVFIGELDDASRRTSATVAWERGKSRKVEPGGGVFTQGSAAPAISGFSGHSFTRSAGTATAPVEETAYIYTNIRSPGTRKAFWKVYGLDAEMDANNQNKARASGSVSYKTVTDDQNQTTTTAMLSGSFDGARGKFTCDGDSSSCSAAITNGEPAFTGTWKFEPGSLTNGVTLAQDAEFLYFGIWESMPGITSDAHDFQVIHGGNPANYAGAADVLAGTATFKGGAVGKYVTRNQVGRNARIGTFTADAEFNAVFGDTDTLAGAIRNFREGGGDLGGWSITLGHADDAANPATLTSGDASGAVAASIGGVSATGVWSATLYASDNQTLDDRTKYPLAKYPEADLAGVAGRFEASDVADAANANVAIAGAFAATPSR